MNVFSTALHAAHNFLYRFIYQIYISTDIRTSIYELLILRQNYLLHFTFYKQQHKEVQYTFLVFWLDSFTPSNSLFHSFIFQASSVNCTVPLFAPYGFPCVCVLTKKTFCLLLHVLITPDSGDKKDGDFQMKRYIVRGTRARFVDCLSVFMIQLLHDEEIEHFFHCILSRDSFFPFLRKLLLHQSSRQKWKEQRRAIILYLLLLFFLLGFLLLLLGCNLQLN